MTSAESKGPSRRARLGWGILLFVATMMVLNGVTWFFLGPNVSAAYAARVDGVTLEQFALAHPQVVAHLGNNARQVAVWYGGFGLITLIFTLDGFRTGSRRAWMATWAAPTVLIAIGLVYLGEQLSFDNAGLIGFGAIALVGQLLAYRRQPDVSAAVSQPSA